MFYELYKILVFLIFMIAGFALVDGDQRPLTQNDINTIQKALGKPKEKLNCKLTAPHDIGSCKGAGLPPKVLL